MEKIKVTKLKWMIISAVVLVFTGIVLIMIGIWCPPIGEIHPSLLTALGEIFSFSGCLFGINANYRFKTFINQQNLEDKLKQTKKDE